MQVRLRHSNSWQAAGGDEITVGERCWSYFFLYIYESGNSVNSFQRICSIFGQLAPSGALQFFCKTLEFHKTMCWREDGRSGKDDILGHMWISSFVKLEKHFRFLGRELISQ